MRILESSQRNWQPVRPELTSGIAGKLIRDGATRTVLTRVAPGGYFACHTDSYDHLLICLEGCGEVSVADHVHPFTPGTVIEISAGEPHAYRNIMERELLLMTLNLAVEHDGPVSGPCNRDNC